MARLEMAGSASAPRKHVGFGGWRAPLALDEEAVTIANPTVVV
jgi:hypothetical protein